MEYNPKNFRLQGAEDMQEPRIVGIDFCDKSETSIVIEFNEDGSVKSYKESVANPHSN